MVEKIKQTRVVIDELTQRSQNLDIKSSEISLTVTAFQLAKMWLGQALKGLGTANPYPESKDPNSSKIEPTADTAVAPMDDEHYPDHVSKVKFLRKAGSELEEVIKLIRNQTHEESEHTVMALLYCQKYLIEAVMWLGMELGRIHDENKEVSNA